MSVRVLLLHVALLVSVFQPPVCAQTVFSDPLAVVDVDYPFSGTHIGVDLGASEGEPVYAIADGQVFYYGPAAECYGGGGGGCDCVPGEVLFIRHRKADGNYFIAQYGHIQNVPTSLRYNKWWDRNGPWIEAGAQVAEVGVFAPCRGCSSARCDHLHFGIWDSNEPIPPGYWGWGSACWEWPTGCWVDPLPFLASQTPYGNPPQIHRDRLSLAYGTTDGGFELVEQSPGQFALVARSKVSEVTDLITTPATVPVSGANVKGATVAGQYVFAALSDGNIYFAPLADATTPGKWGGVSPQPPNAGSVQAIGYSAGYVYSFGSGTVYAAHFRSDGTLGDWFTAGTLPLSISGYGAVASQGYFFYTGGNFGGYNYSDRVFSAPISADGTLAGWTEFNEMPEAKGSHGCVVSNEHLFVVGGLANSGGAINPTVNCYSAKIQGDGTIGSWVQTANHPLSGGIWGFPLLSVGDALITVGGWYMDWWNYWSRAASGIYQCEVKSDGTTANWQNVGSITPAVRGHGAVVDAGRVLAFGGDGDVYEGAYNYVWEGYVETNTDAVRTARYQHDFSVQTTAVDKELAWDSTVGPNSQLEMRYRLADPESGTYSIWSSWFSASPVAIAGSTNRIGYELRATIASGESVELRSVELSYRETIHGDTPVGINLPVNVGTGITCVFDEVSSGGVTSYTPVSEPPTLPPAFDLVSAFNLATTAATEGVIRVAVDLRGLYSAGESFDLLHYKSGAWEVVTSLFDSAALFLFGRVTGFSTFAVVHQSQQTGILPALLTTAFQLRPAFPNPFNPTATITYTLPEVSHVRLDVYDVTGRHLTTLVDRTEERGEHIVRWDATGFASGVYFYRLNAGSNTATRKMVLLQ